MLSARLAAMSLPCGRLSRYSEKYVPNEERARAAKQGLWVGTLAVGLPRRQTASRHHEPARVLARHRQTIQRAASRAISAARGGSTMFRARASTRRFRSNLHGASAISARKRRQSSADGANLASDISITINQGDRVRPRSANSGRPNITLISNRPDTAATARAALRGDESDVGSMEPATHQEWRGAGLVGGSTNSVSKSKLQATQRNAARRARPQKRVRWLAFCSPLGRTEPASLSAKCQ